jgi:hypothetical protein
MPRTARRGAGWRSRTPCRRAAWPGACAAFPVSPGTDDGRDRVPKWHESRRVVGIGGREPDGERDSVAAGDLVVLGAGLTPANRVWTRVRALYVARTLKLSTLARFQSTAAPSPSQSSNPACTPWRPRGICGAPRSPRPHIRTAPAPTAPPTPRPARPPPPSPTASAAPSTSTGEVRTAARGAASEPQRHRPLLPRQVLHPHHDPVAVVGRLAVTSTGASAGTSRNRPVSGPRRR